MRDFRQGISVKKRLKGPGSIATKMIPWIGRFRIFAAVGHVVFGGFAEAVIRARIAFAFAQIQDVAMATVPVVEVRTIFEAVRIKAAVFLIEAAHRVRAAEEAAGTCAHETMISGDVAGLSLSAGGRAGARLADVSDTGNGLAVAEG